MAINRVFGWLARKSLLYIAIVAAILAGAFVVPWIKSEWTGPAAHLGNAVRLEEVQSQLESERADVQRRLAHVATTAQEKSLSELDQALAAARQDKAELVKRRRSRFKQAVSLSTFDADGLLKDGRLELEIQLRDAEIRGLVAARSQLANRIKLELLAPKVRALIVKANQSSVGVRDAQAQCSRASQELEAFEDRWMVRLTFQIYDRERHRELENEKRGRCTEADRRVTGYRLQRAAAEAAMRKRAEAVEAYRQSRGWADSRIKSVTGNLEQQIAAERITAQGSWRAKAELWAKEVHFFDVLRNAAIVLALIIASPFVIRLFCYFILAPAAMRRHVIRLRVPGGSGAAIPTADRSTTSVGVRLRAGEELLVRQDYLQTTSHTGSKATQWFLNWRLPITSMATGLTFLTRIRGEDELTTISAVKDPFAEVTVVTLPEGASCVLQPRALAAVVHSIGRPLHIETSWRIRSLTAWLTMQLRYLVFHGPARLVVKGGRGVRVERAEQGRIFGHDQLVGFSADLAYSVTRTETFWPYFLGREQLLKDRVGIGEGVLIIEEAPMAGRRSGEVRRGIEGLIDAGMKVFGM